MPLMQTVGRVHPTFCNSVSSMVTRSVSKGVLSPAGVNPVMRGVISELLANNPEGLGSSGRNVNCEN